MHANKPPQIMGILNVTPDSFSDGGHFADLESALVHAMQMIDQGANIIDIGGESTRPGSEPVSEQEQMRRVLGVIRELRRRIPANVPISIDTTSSTVAEAALDAGADWINDTSAGLDSRGMLPLAAERGVPIVLMHRQGMPASMQDNPDYQDVVAEVRAFLLERANAAVEAGVLENRLLIDPGIGFGKFKEHNLALLAGLTDLAGLGIPLLLGTSRKRFMGSICGETHPERLAPATCATTALGVMAGVRVFRVHDVTENRQAADVAWAILKARRTPHRRLGRA